MKASKCIFFIATIIVVVTGCKQEFKPKILQTNLNRLVVDGFLDNSNATTTITLSRTKTLDNGLAGSAETSASIFLEDESGNILYTFLDNFNGNYTVNGMNLDPSKKYRLKINTADGKLYATDPITVKQTPAMDSVSWKKENTGVNIYVTTHDSQNNTQYYRWEFEETWQYVANNFSYLIYDNNSVRLRDPSEMVFDCWRTFNSGSLLLGSSAKLSKDVIFEFPLNSVPLGSEQIGIMYSILVKQYGLTKECFDYLQNLKKITEQMGSLFDAQPSQLGGNIKCLTNPEEPVIGFMTASTKVEKRIFIKRAEVQPWNYSYYCDAPITVTPDSVEFYFDGGGYIPTDELFPPGSGYHGNQVACVECTARGGTTQKPSFWP